VCKNEKESSRCLNDLLIANLSGFGLEMVCSHWSFVSSFFLILFPLNFLMLFSSQQLPYDINYFMFTHNQTCIISLVLTSHSYIIFFFLWSSITLSRSVTYDVILCFRHTLTFLFVLCFFSGSFRSFYSSHCFTLIVYGYALHCIASLVVMLNSLWERIALF